jgi:hypothetical protein
MFTQEQETAIDNYLDGLNMYSKTDVRRWLQGIVFRAVLQCYPELFKTREQNNVE